MDDVHHGGGERPYLGTPVAHLYDTLYEGWDRGAVAAVDERWAATLWAVVDELGRRADAGEGDEALRRLLDVTLDLLVSTMPAVAKVGDGALLDQIEAHVRQVHTEEVHRFRLVSDRPIDDDPPPAATRPDRRSRAVLRAVWWTASGPGAGGDMGADDLVRDHYSGADLEERVLAALRGAGIDVDRLRVEDLAGLDQLHAGGVAATTHVLDHLDLSPETPLLDVGAGVGGPARVAAARHGCPVTGIDLSPDFVVLARSLTRRIGLDGSASFDVGSATELPYGDASFARAMLVHAGMNMPEKGAVFAEVRRVLAPGGLFGLYEQVRTGDGDLTFPLPWADDASTSFVETRERYGELLEQAGFRVEHDEDRTAANAAGPPAPGALGPGALFGSGFAERLANNIAAAMHGTLAAVLLVARAV